MSRKAESHKGLWKGKARGRGRLKRPFTWDPAKGKTSKQPQRRDQGCGWKETVNENVRGWGNSMEEVQETAFLVQSPKRFLRLWRQSVHGTAGSSRVTRNQGCPERSTRSKEQSRARQTLLEGRNGSS